MVVVFALAVPTVLSTTAILQASIANRCVVREGEPVALLEAVTRALHLRDRALSEALDVATVRPRADVFEGVRSCVTLFG